MAFLYDLNFKYLGLNPTHKTIAVAYADHAHHDGGGVYPANKTIALKTEHARRTVQRAVRELENAGLMISDGVQPSGVRRWKFELDELYLYTGVRLAGVSESHPLGRQGVMGGASESPSRGVTESPKPSITNSIKLKDLIELWIELFPDKPKPNGATKSYQSKAHTRLKEPEFRRGWEEALRRAATSPTLQKESWFNFAFFIRNDTNWQNCRDGWMDWKDQQTLKGRPAAANGEAIADDVEKFKSRGARNA